MQIGTAESLVVTLPLRHMEVGSVRPPARLRARLDVDGLDSGVVEAGDDLLRHGRGAVLFGVGG